MPKILRYYLEQEAMAVVPHGTAGGTVSMSYPVLSPARYTAWAIKVEAILDAQGLWKAVSPSGDAVVDAQKNKTARAQLLQALPEDILMQVSTKKTAKEVWESLKTRFVGTDRVKTACLATLKGEFDKLCMVDGDVLDDYAGKISGMAAKFAGLGSTLDDVTMVKKLLDTVPDHLYPAVAGIEQFCDVETMAFEEALGRLKVFDERSRWCAQIIGAQAANEVQASGDKLLLADADKKDRNKSTIGKCFNCGIRGHFTRDCRKPKKEEALLAKADEEASLL
jgi:hypothetical protein